MSTSLNPGVKIIYQFKDKAIPLKASVDCDINTAAAPSKKIAFVFPGQGAQFVGMGRELVASVPTAWKLYVEASEILGFDLLDHLPQRPGRAAERDRHQPAGDLRDEFGGSRIATRHRSGSNRRMCGDSWTQS